MKILKVNDGPSTDLLRPVTIVSNYEVLKLLEEHTETPVVGRVDPALQDYKTLLHTGKKYLSDPMNPCSVQSEDQIRAFVQSVQGLGLTKTEILMIINSRPVSMVELIPLVEEAGERQAAASHRALQADPLSREFARKLDEKSVHFRDDFVIPTVREVVEHERMACALNIAIVLESEEELAASCVYLCGNSLGLQPKETRRLLNEELDVWAAGGVTGHFRHRHNRPWVSIDEVAIGPSARIVGAKDHEVAVMNTLTANLHFLMVPFYRPTPGRFKIIMEAKAFPSDYFALESQVQYHGLDPKTAIVQVAPKPGEYTLQTKDILQTIAEHGDTAALVLFSGVQYYTGQYFDIPAITKAAHDKPAGWWGTNEEVKFEMDLTFRPIPGAKGFRLSNPSVLTTVALKASLDVFGKTTMAELSVRSRQLTGYLEFLVDSLLPKTKVQIITPRDETQRGCQLSLLFPHPGDMMKVFHYISARGVICDERKPDVIRVAPAPLYNNFEDVWRCVDLIRKAILASE
ncbi:hypothetical protein HDU91_000788 [Kappamyces sp. JEL0680]|nr:hypothetical protein HDU91_000788 [Kappamyces sp. JEL0680]